MSETYTTVTVRILDKEYQVNCPNEEVEELTRSAQHLDDQMRTIRDSGKVFGLDRIAVMAALNIAHDFLDLQQDHISHTAFVDQKIPELTERISRTLEKTRQLNL